MKPGLRWAMVSYLALAVLAALTLDGVFRALVWLVLGALAVKTWINVIRERQQ